MYYKATILFCHLETKEFSNMIQQIMWQNKISIKLNSINENFEIDKHQV